MTQELLHMADGGPVLKHVGGTGMPKGMGGDPLLKGRLSGIKADSFGQLRPAHLSPLGAARKERLTLRQTTGGPPFVPMESRSHHRQILLKQLTKPLSQGEHPPPPPFSFPVGEGA